MQAACLLSCLSTYELLLLEQKVSLNRGDIVRIGGLRNSFDEDPFTTFKMLPDPLQDLSPTCDIFPT